MSFRIEKEYEAERLRDELDTEPVQKDRSRRRRNNEPRDDRQQEK